MSILDVLEIGLEVGIDVLKGEKSFLEGLETVLERTGEEEE